MEPNINRSSFPFDLNVIPNSFLSNQTYSNNSLFDLNSEPYYEEYEFFNSETNDGEDEHLDTDLLEEINTDVVTTKKLRNLSNDERRAIHGMLRERSVYGKLHPDDTKVVAAAFSISRRTVQRIWKQSKDSPTGDVSHRRTSNCGRKRVEVDREKILGILLNKRKTLKSLSCSLEISESKAFRLLKEGQIQRHTNAIKPALNENHRKNRVRFCISQLEENSLMHDPIFKGMYNIVHIDEKWFLMTKKSERYYLLPDEEEPMRTCQSKNFIGKVMFLAAVARPRFDAQGNEVFSGKIGLFPFVTQQPARRSSVNRVAGTLETKPITSVNREIMRAYMIEKVIPAIKQKWPRDEIMHPIFIQQDNARTHIDCNDVEFCEAAKQGGFDIRLVCQPANFPDLNVLDLGFFNAIQSLQHEESPRTVDELVGGVIRSFEKFSTVKSNHVFLTLQLCMVEILKVRGCHKYKIPHINKERLERNGNLPTRISCDAALVQQAIEFLG